MYDLHLLPLTEKDLAELEQWHSDKSINVRYESEDWPNKLLKFMKKHSNRTCWVAWERKKRIGYVDCEIQNSIAWIGLVVNPTIHSQGYGKQILRVFEELPFLQTLKEIRAGIEEDNVPSLRCFEGAGFTRLNKELDHEGIINFSKRIGTTFSFDELVQKILALPKASRKTLIIAVDGHGGSGKSTFAKKFADGLKKEGVSVSIVSLDGFPLRKRPEDLLSLCDHPQVRTPFRIDSQRLRSEVLEPLFENRNAQYHYEDWWDSSKITQQNVPTGGVVIIEGCYALLPELRPYYDFSILIDTPFEVSKERSMQRDMASSALPMIGKLLWEEIYYPHEKRYMETEKIREISDLVIT